MLLYFFIKAVSGESEVWMRLFKVGSGNAQRLSTKKLNHSFSWKYKLCDILWWVFLDYPSLLFAGFFVSGWMTGWMVDILSCCCLVNWSRCKRILNLNWSKQPVLCVHPLLSVWMINQAYVSPVVIRRRPQIIKFVSFSRL